MEVDINGPTNGDEWSQHMCKHRHQSKDLSTSRLVGHGRYRRSIQFHLRKITVNCQSSINERDYFLLDTTDETCANFGDWDACGGAAACRWISRQCLGEQDFESRWCCQWLQWLLFQNVIQLQPHGSKTPVIFYRGMWLQRWLHISKLLSATTSQQFN